MKRTLQGLVLTAGLLISGAALPPHAALASGPHIPLAPPSGGLNASSTVSHVTQANEQTNSQTPSTQAGHSVFAPPSGGFTTANTTSQVTQANEQTNSQTPNTQASHGVFAPPSGGFTAASTTSQIAQATGQPNLQPMSPTGGTSTPSTGSDTTATRGALPPPSNFSDALGPNLAFSFSGDSPMAVGQEEDVTLQATSRRSTAQSVSFALVLDQPANYQSPVYLGEMSLEEIIQEPSGFSCKTIDAVEAGCSGELAAGASASLTVRIHADAPGDARIIAAAKGSAADLYSSPGGTDPYATNAIVHISDAGSLAGLAGDFSQTITPGLP